MFTGSCVFIRKYVIQLRLDGIFAAYVFIKYDNDTIRHSLTLAIPLQTFLVLEVLVTKGRKIK